MKEYDTRKALQYLCIDPMFDIQKIKQGALRYSRNEKPVLMHNGQRVYGRLEMFELLPDEFERSFIYIGWRDFTDADEMMYQRAKRWGGVTEL